MERRIEVFNGELYKNIWISYAIVKDEYGTLDHFQFENDFVHTFGKTDTEAKDKLEILLKKREDILETDFEAFF